MWVGGSERERKVYDDVNECRKKKKNRFVFLDNKKHQKINKNENCSCDTFRLTFIISFLR